MREGPDRIRVGSLTLRRSPGLHPHLLPLPCKKSCSSLSP